MRAGSSVEGDTACATAPVGRGRMERRLRRRRGRAWSRVTGPLAVRASRRCCGPSPARCRGRGARADRRPGGRAAATPAPPGTRRHPAGQRRWRPALGAARTSCCPSWRRGSRRPTRAHGRGRRWPRWAWRSRASHLAEELSGGQQQRVAVARGPGAAGPGAARRRADLRARPRQPRARPGPAAGRGRAGRGRRDGHPRPRGGGAGRRRGPSRRWTAEPGARGAAASLSPCRSRSACRSTRSPGRPSCGPSAGAARPSPWRWPAPPRSCASSSCSSPSSTRSSGVTG